MRKYIQRYSKYHMGWLSRNRLLIGVALNNVPVFLNYSFNVLCYWRITNKAINLLCFTFRSLDQAVLLGRDPKTCYSRLNPLRSQFRNNSEILEHCWERHPSTPSGLQETFKRPPNVRNMLVTVDLSTHFLSNILFGNYKCGGCQQCSFMYKTQTFNKTFKIRKTITCKTANVIYMWRCPCGLCYAGKTNRQLKTRIAQH